MEFNTNKFIIESINKIILEDHHKFLKSIYLKYGELGEFSLEYSQEKYKIDNILVIPNKNPKPKKKVNRKIKILDPRHRCMARCWGGEKYVKYDSSNKEWSYGYQCHRKKLPNFDFCGLHQNEIDNGYLTHGRIDGEVPHLHYNKYKIKIEKQNSIKNK